ncbi:MAG: fimbrial biogenesis outer membrane usher protein [Azonexaceae bacterium]|nr:fimbrial biogenesis outer membrane usher protein [Azonexaceae bacterium]
MFCQFCYRNKNLSKVKRSIILIAVISCFSGNLHSAFAAEDGVRVQTEATVSDGEQWDVTLFVNGQKSTGLVTVSEKNGEIFIDAQDFLQFNVDIGQGFVALKGLDPKYEFNRRKLTITTTLESARFAKQEMVVRTNQAYPYLETAYGGWLNYNVNYANYGDRAGIQALLDGTISTKWGNLNSQHTYNSLNTEQPFKRMSTTFRMEDRETLRVTELGDTISIPGYWGSYVRMMGIRISRDFKLQQGFEWLPSHTLNGEAKLPSVVDIYEGSRRVYTGNVAPGLFSLPYTPVTNTGEVSVIVKDQFGNEVRKSYSLFSSPQQLSRGVDNYSVEIGALRQADTYGEMFFAGRYRRGVGFSGIPLLGWIDDYIQNLTLEGRIEGTRGNTRFGLGAAFATWFGNMSVAGALAKTDQKTFISGTMPAAQAGNGQGQQSQADESDYKASSATPSLFVATWDRSFDFGHYGTVSGFASTTMPTNWTAIGSVFGDVLKPQTYYGVTYAPSSGKYSVSFIGTQTGEGKEKFLSQAINATARFDYVDVGLSVGKTDVGNTAMLTLSIPLGRFGINGTAMASVAKGSSYANYSGMSNENNARYNIGVGQGESGQRIDAYASGDFRYGSLTASASSANGVNGYRLSGSGSVAYADGGLWLDKQIANGLVIADTGIPDLPVLASDVYVGKTDDNGRIAITRTTDHISLADDLGDWTKTKDSSKRFSQQRGSIGLVKLSADAPGYSLLLRVNGQPIEAGEIRVDGKAFAYNVSTGAYVTKIGTGKRTIEVVGCKREVVVPDLVPKTDNEFEIKLDCGTEK